MPADRHALIVIDLQADFCPGGARAVSGGDAIVGRVNALMAPAGTVVLTQDWHPAGHASFASNHPCRKPFDVLKLAYGNQVLWPDHCVQGTEGAALHRDLSVPHAQLVIRKGYNRDVDSYSAFIENDRTTPTGLAGWLRERGIARLSFAGLATDYCVAWSALDAVREGFAAEVILPACRAIDLGGSLAAALGALAAAGVAIREDDR